MLPSKKVILDWMSRICEERKDVIFIYRPHPGEESAQAEEMAKKYDNFKVISELSVKQWILISDKIYTGNSSTFVEAFFAKKMCYFLFPYPVPEDYELFMIKGANRITDYETFKQSTQDNDMPFPVKEEIIDSIYSIDWQKPSYVKFADMAEEVLKDSYYNLTKEQLKAYYHKMGIVEKCQKMLIKITPLYDWYLSKLENENIHWKWLEPMRKSRENLKQIAHDHAYEQASEEEINAIVARIAALLEHK